jgi:hypothetical protein
MTYERVTNCVDSRGADCYVEPILENISPGDSLPDGAPVDIAGHCVGDLCWSSGPLRRWNATYVDVLVDYSRGASAPNLHLFGDLVAGPSVEETAKNTASARVSLESFVLVFSWWPILIRSARHSRSF